MITFKTTAVTAVLAGACALGTAPAFAGAKDYAFQIVDKEIKHGAAIVSVRLVDNRTGQAVPDAVIYKTRLDMGPDGMETMTTPISALPVDQPGVYRFKTDLTMAGNWALSLAAKVQGETETIPGKLAIKATL
jgi:hypothetical protein